MNTELQPLEWNPDELDPTVVALIRKHKPRSKETNPNAELEEAIRQELEAA